MKRALIAALASLMLAGALAGAGESPLPTTGSTLLSLGDGSSPTPVDPPAGFAYGDSIQR